MKPHIDLRKKFYDKVYQGFEGIAASWFSPSETFAAWRTKSTIEIFFGESIRPGMKVLDLGCGIGSDIFSLNLYCTLNNIEADFYGMDISKTAVKLARKTANVRGYKNCRFFCGDIETFEMHKRFDIILCSQTLEHTLDMKGTMQRVASHLAGRGVFIMSLPFSDRIKLYAPMFIKKKIWKGSEWGLKKAGKHVIEAVKLEQEFESKSGGHLAHPSILPLKQIKDNLISAGFRIDRMKRAFIVEGNKWFDDHPLVFASLIVVDKLLPFKRFGSDIIIIAVKM